MRFTCLLPVLALRAGFGNAASDRADAIIYAMGMIEQSSKFIESGLNGWSGKSMDFLPVRFEMHVINRLISNGTRTATNSRDLIPEDFDEVVGAAQQLAQTTERTMMTFDEHVPRLRLATLGYFVKTQLQHEQKAFVAFAEAVVQISPSLPNEVEDILGRQINELYQRIIDILKTYK